jgi:hypothetical protein
MIGLRSSDISAIYWRVLVLKGRAIYWMMFGIRSQNYLPIYWSGLVL